MLRGAVAHSEPHQQTRSRLELLHPSDLGGLAEGASYHGISSYVLAASDEGALVPPAERQKLREQRRVIATHHLRMLGNLRLLRDVLDAAEVPWLIVKGPTLAEPVHGSPILRGYNDLDAVVPGSHLRRAMTALSAAGARDIESNWSVKLHGLKGEVDIALPNGTKLDLHWHLLNSSDRRQSFPIEMADLFKRSRTVQIGGLDVPTLGAVDTVVYVALHAVLSGADRLIWLKDVERLLAMKISDPQEIAARAHQWNAELALASLLERIDSTIGLPPTGHELRAALPRYRIWMPVARAAWHRQPVERFDGSGSLGRLVARSVRPTQGATLRRLVAKSTSFVVASLRGRQEGGHNRPVDPASTSDSGGAAAREAYLDAVAQQS